MLVGRVTPEGEAVVPIEIVAGGQAYSLEATIDTGYNGYLTLPSTIIGELDLPFAGTARAELGDGREVPLDLFLATVQWHGEPKEVLVLSTEGNVLLGMMALLGSRVTLDVVDDGSVTIEPL